MKKALAIAIKEGTAAEAAALLHQIPEFKDSYPLEEYQKRLSREDHLILLAYDTAAGQPVGSKVGYKLSDGCFYSWMGGVLPAWRRHGVAEMLAVAQEEWLRERAYTRLRFKTRNSCRAMLHFALSREFHIVGVEPREHVADYRIWLEKAL